jgi:hypothetical protein
MIFLNFFIIKKKNFVQNKIKILIAKKHNKI